jgi:hypothetical protein
MVERDAPVVDARNARGVPPPVPPRIFVQLEKESLYESLGAEDVSASARLGTAAMR